MLSTELHEGMVVGYRNFRAVVRGVNQQAAYLHWREELPRRKHFDCDGTGTLVVLRKNLDGETRPVIEGCRTCQGTGYLPPQTVSHRRWVDLDELTPAPPRPKCDPEATSLAMELFRKAGAR